MLATRFRFVMTEVGGCAIDVDTDAEYDVICERFTEWAEQQRVRAESVVGLLPPVVANASSTSEAPDDRQTAAAKRSDA